MKKTILAAALGIAASVTSSYGQGSIFFNNYGASTDAIVSFAPVDVPEPVDSSWTAGLRYSFAGGYLMDLGVKQAFNPVTPGYFQGPIVTIPGYAGGPITFQVYAFYGGPDLQTALYYGYSTPFTLPSIATGTQPAGEFGPAFKPFTIYLPEPSTIALLGLGLVSLLFFRRQR